MSQFLIYKSSAGSGKTTALIGIFLKLTLSSPRPDAFKQVLAITFTNKAANEMKERLISELDKLSNLPDPYTGNDFMTNMLLEETGLSANEIRQRAWNTFQLLLHDYGDLAISTIDQFNHRLIRTFSRELNLKADFEVELDEKNLFHEAVIRVVDQVGKDEHLTRHLIGFITHMLGDDKKVNLVTQLENLRPLILSEDALEPLAALQSFDKTEYPDIIKFLRTQTRAYEKAVKTMGEETLSWIDSVGITEADLAGKSNSWLSYFRKMTKFGGECIECTPTQEKSKGLDWAHTKASAGARALIATHTAELEARLQAAFQLNEKGFGDYLLHKTILNQIDLIAVLGDLASALEEIRNERNILPISYFNRIVSEALREEPVAFLYENFGNRFHHILIDEFQDTSTLQWLNLLPLVEESLARGNTSLVVGDAKQSIYRWRGGRAEQLISLPLLDEFNIAIDPFTRESLIRSAKILNLSTNYRSLSEIINFNNALFATLGAQMTSAGSLFEKEYQAGNVFQQLPSKKEGGYVEVRYLGKDADSEIHCDHLLRQINQAKENGFDYSDMAILVRSTSKDGNAIVSHLNRFGIPVSTRDSFEIDQHLPVKLIIALMRLGSKPHLVPPKITAMRALSALHHFDFEPHLFKEGDKNIDFKKFLASRNLPALRSQWFDSGAYQVCENLMNTYCPDYAHHPYMVTLLNTILKKGGTAITVNEFIEWWEDLPVKPSSAGSDTSSAIQMLTIHKSKGLQFKVCFIPGANWMLNLGKDFRWFHLGDRKVGNLAYAPLPLNKKLEKMGFVDAFSSEENAVNFDNLNMVYVALTRAEQQLYVNFTHKNKNQMGSALLEACQKVAGDLSGKPGFSMTGMSETGDSIDGLPGPDEPFLMRLGKPQPKSHKPEKSDDSVLINRTLTTNKMWFERFEMAYDRNGYGHDLSRKTGILFHNIVAETTEIETAEKIIVKLEKEGFIEGSECGVLSEMVSALLSDQKYSDLNKGARRYAEREILYNGEVLRPDLVIESETQVTIIDFKTGGEEAAHVEQILRYTNAMQDILKKPAEGFVIYFSPFRWLKAGENIPLQTRLFD